MLDDFYADESNEFELRWEEFIREFDIVYEQYLMEADVYFENLMN